MGICVVHGITWGICFLLSFIPTSFTSLIDCPSALVLHRNIPLVIWFDLHLAMLNPAIGRAIIYGTYDTMLNPTIRRLFIIAIQIAIIGVAESLAIRIRIVPVWESGLGSQLLSSS